MQFLKRSVRAGDSLRMVEELIHIALKKFYPPKAQTRKRVHKAKADTPNMALLKLARQLAEEEVTNLIDKRKPALAKTYLHIWKHVTIANAERRKLGTKKTVVSE